MRLSDEFEDGVLEYGNPEPEWERAPAKAPLPPGCVNPRFPKPPGVPRRDLTAGKVACATRADAHRILAATVKNAVAMMTNTIDELVRAREGACRGGSTGWPALGDVTACWLKYKLGVCIDRREAWTAPSTSNKSVAEVIRRLMRPRDELAANQFRFVCEATCEANVVAFVTVRDAAGNCLPGTPAQIIHLCPLFWAANMAPYREQAIIHESVHLTHCAGGIEDRRIAASIGSPTCLAQFVAATNGKKLNPLEGFPCGNTARCGAIPADAPANCGAEMGE